MKQRIGTAAGTIIVASLFSCGDIAVNSFDGAEQDIATGPADVVAIQIPCATDLECDNGDTCREGECGDDGFCLFTELSGPSCDDGNPCTATSACVTGVCTGGDRITCEAPAPECVENDSVYRTWTTDGVCDDATGDCLFDPIDTPCNDCAQNCLQLCKDVVCEETNGGCRDEGACTVENDTPSCQYATVADDGATCDLGGDETGYCLAGACVECSTDAQCDDGNGCTFDSCEEATRTCLNVPYPAGTECSAPGNLCAADTCSADGTCNAANAPDGVSCDDGNPCTTADACDAGTCLGAAIGCDDGNACTADTCVEGSCVHTATDGPCSDNNVCTTVDTCVDGTCVGSQLTPCEDGNSCTADFCDAVSGCASTSLVGVLCDDGIPCTDGDACDEAGDCTGQAVECDDDNPCTDDSCDPQSGQCVYAPNALACDDGNACTDGDTCGGGTCNPGTVICACQTNDDCDDENLCDGTFICDVQGQFGPPNTCQNDPASVITCDTNDDTECLVTTCQPVDGACMAVPVAAASPCDDGQACTHGDACDGAGSCVGQTITCDDDPGICGAKRSCNGTDACSVTFASATTSCDDGAACTHTDRCNGAGGCEGTGISCTDDPGTCGAKRSCDGTDTCVVTLPDDAVDCDDGQACTHTDRCDGQGACKGTPLSCTSDPGPCGAIRSCDGTPTCTESFPSDTTVCDDGNACTHTDVCDGAGGCKGTSISCQDDAGTCGANRACNGTSTCTVTFPTSTTSCNDGNKCTPTDRCNGSGQCTGSGSLTCNDNNPCTNDSCNASSGCVYSPKSNGTSCPEDGSCANCGCDLCIGNAYCWNGSCQQECICDDAP